MIWEWRWNKLKAFLNQVITRKFCCQTFLTRRLNMRVCLRMKISHPTRKQTNLITNVKTWRYIINIIAKKLNWDRKDGLVIIRLIVLSWTQVWFPGSTNSHGSSQTSLTMVQLESIPPSDLSKHQHSHAHNPTQTHTCRHTQLTQVDSNVNTINQMLVLITENAQKLFHLQFLHKPTNFLDNI